MFRYALILGGIALAVLAVFHPVAHPPAAVFPSQPSPPSLDAAPLQPRRVRDTIVVYVAGAVHRPGLYRLSPGARADEAVKRAGGFTSAADPAGVNLAQRLDDGEEVDVPERGAPLRRRARSGTHRRSRSHRHSDVGAVELNNADARRLGRVPGIGGAIAERIVEVREREGPFASLDELLDVAGMNAGRLERARSHLVIAR